MNEMKTDKTGAAVVSSFMLTYAANRGSKTVLAFLPLSQNSISQKATLPGDVLRAYNGSTVEVTDTDGEGRLVIADCLAYSTTFYKNSKHIDIGTLTGQQYYLSGYIFGNVISRHQEFNDEIVRVGNLTGEKIIAMPYVKKFEEKMVSTIADYKNFNSENRADLMQSTTFLGFFVPKSVEWAHIDIGGVGWKIEDNYSYLNGDSSGFGHRILNKLIT